MTFPTIFTKNNKTFELRLDFFLWCYIHHVFTSHQKNHTCPSGPVNSVSIASRVVPLMGLTIVLSSPTNAFKMLLLPTFGLPTMEIAGTYSSSSSRIFDSYSSAIKKYELKNKGSRNKNKN